MGGWMDGWMIEQGIDPVLTDGRLFADYREVRLQDFSSGKETRDNMTS
jgi:hypothetical protein